MTKDMPLDGKLSLDMMFRTCGTQLNIDYNSEEDFIKKFKIINSIVPISIALFANSSIVEKKKSNFLSYRSKVWQNTSRGGLPKLFLENLDFEKYAEFVINFPILFIQNQNTYISGKKYTFKDFTEGKIEEMGDADQIYNTPKTEYTKRLIDAIPEGKLEDIKEHLEKKGVVVS